MTSQKFIIILVIILSAAQCYSQKNFDIRKQKLKPEFIDTAKEKIFIYEVANAVLYFKQSDILSFINNPKNTKIYPNSSFHKLIDTLKSNTKRIRIKDILYSYGEIERDSILNHQPISADVQKIDEEFHIIGGNLILNGQFMIYSKEANKFVVKHLVAKKHISASGQQDLMFLLPNGKVFYDTLIRLGE